ncbi:MAG: peptidoglycan-binding domain-containing protein [Saprospiraceae bacterium]
MKFSTKHLLLTLVTLLFVTTIFGQNEETDIPFVDLPPTNEYGKCYAKCKSPDQFETVTREVLVKQATNSITTIAAVYETRTETILVKEAAKQYTVIPAQYTTVTENVMIYPTRTVTTMIPAKYGKESKQVLVSPARGAWVKKKKDPNCFSKKPEDCYIACYEEVPAKYRTETYQVVVQPARAVEKVIPAKFTTVTKSVVSKEATVQEYLTEPKYKTVKTKVLVSPESVEEIAIPAQYRTVSEKVLIREGGYTVWTEILCASQTSSGTIRRVQQSLTTAGYNPGVADGIMGLQTQTALKQFQTDKALPIGNLNLETLKALGVKY